MTDTFFRGDYKSNKEGLIAFGVASGLYNPANNPTYIYGSVVTMNNFDPSPSWVYGDEEKVDIREAQACNDNIQLDIDPSVVDSDELVSLRLDPKQIISTVGSTETISVYAKYRNGVEIDVTSSASLVLSLIHI